MTVLIGKNIGATGDNFSVGKWLLIPIGKIAILFFVGDPIAHVKRLGINVLKRRVERFSGFRISFDSPLQDVRPWLVI